MYKKLFVYAGDKHSHSAQQPKELKFWLAQNINF
jgi:ribosomal protein L13